MSNLKDLIKEREEKKAELDRIRNAERQERFMQAKRILPNKVLEYVKNSINKDLDRESVFIDFEELVEFVNPQIPRTIIFWKTQNAWPKDKAQDAVRNVLREVAETIASHGLSVEYISGYNLRIRCFSSDFVHYRKSELTYLKFWIKNSANSGSLRHPDQYSRIAASKFLFTFLKSLT